MNETPPKTPRPTRVVVIGSVNMDLIVRTNNLPEAGETVIGTDLITVPGGKGANQAVAAARLGARVDMVGRVGNDVFGRTLLDQLRDAGVHTEHVARTADCPSGLAVISVDAQGENAITVVSGANARLSPDDVEDVEPLIERADVVLMQLEVPLPSLCVAAELARKHKVMSVLDPAPAPARGCGLPTPLRQVDVICPNRGEAELLTGERVRDAQEAKLVATELIRQGARFAVVKLGAHGAVAVCADGTVLHEPGFRVSVEDTTAAGDAFAAALAIGRAEGQPWAKAVRLGCAAGALATTKLGAQVAMPTRDEVMQLARRA